MFGLSEACDCLSSSCWMPAERNRRNLCNSATFPHSLSSLNTLKDVIPWQEFCTLCTRLIAFSGSEATQLCYFLCYSVLSFKCIFFPFFLWFEMIHLILIELYCVFKKVCLKRFIFVYVVMLGVSGIFVWYNSWTQTGTKQFQHNTFTVVCVVICTKVSGRLWHVWRATCKLFDKKKPNIFSNSSLPWQ